MCVGGMDTRELDRHTRGTKRGEGFGRCAVTGLEEEDGARSRGCETLRDRDLERTRSASQEVDPTGTDPVGHLFRGTERHPGMGRHPAMSPSPGDDRLEVVYIELGGGSRGGIEGACILSAARTCLGGYW